MKEFSSKILVICFASLGFASVSQAGVNNYVPMPLQLACDQVGIACVDDETYEVELNCMDIAAVGTDGFRGGLRVEDDYDWDLDVEWAENTSDPTWIDVCDAEGEIEFLLKHEMKCTDAPEGSNKPEKNKDDGFAQVDFEIKYEGEECTTEEPL